MKALYSAILELRNQLATFSISAIPPGLETAEVAKFILIPPKVLTLQVTLINQRIEALMYLPSCYHADPLLTANALQVI